LLAELHARLIAVVLDGFVVVAGVPGSGKTTLARLLAKELQLPLFSKDTIKEALFDVLGTGGLEWSQRLGQAAHRVMYAVAAESQAAVLESHFWRGLAEVDLCVLGRPIVQVYCRCPIELAAERYRQRATSPDRHPGHLPHHQTDEVTKGWREAEPRPLDLEGVLIEVDTSSPLEADDIVALARRVQGSLRQ
jgi:predicted kinase